MAVMATVEELQPTGIVLAECCTNYKYTIKQFYSFREKMHCIKLYCIYFKSMCLVTIPLVDYATLFCLEVTVAEETKELFILCIIFKIIFHNSFNIWIIGRGLVQCSSGQ